MPEKQPQVEVSTDKIPETLPILPLFDATLFPKMVLPLVVMQGESVQLVDEAMSRDRIVGLLVANKNAENPIQPQENLARIGARKRPV